MIIFRRYPVFPGLVVLLLYGCSSFQTPEYPKSILLAREANVSIQYEYGTVTIEIPLKIMDADPPAYRLGIYNGENRESPLLEKVFFSGDPIRVVLPESVLSEQEDGNLAVLAPLGGDYPQQEAAFTRGPETIILPPFEIRKPPVIIRGQVRIKSSMEPFVGAEVRVSDTAGVIEKAYSDSLGWFEIRLLSAYGQHNDLSLTVTSMDRYSMDNRSVDWNSQSIVAFSILLGPGRELSERGTIFRVRQDLTPFRIGPENGSTIQFFLLKGDQIVISKTAGDRAHGFVEIVGYDPGIYQTVSGWVLTRNIELLE